VSLQRIRFLLKHLLIRSPARGERKFSAERLTRYDPVERASRGLRGHYDQPRPGHRFVRSAKEQTLFDDAAFPSMASADGMELIDWGRLAIVAAFSTKDQVIEAAEHLMSEVAILPRSKV
jgi:hypothetical protein